LFVEMWGNLFGSSTTPTPEIAQADTGQQISSFFTGIGTNVNSFFAGISGTAEGDGSDAAAVGQQIGNWFSEVGQGVTEAWGKYTTPTPEQDKEQFAYVKHFGELPATCQKPVCGKYFRQELKDELFEDEYDAFLELKKLPCCEGFSDRFAMACLFARKLDIKRTEEMLLKNKAWRTENGYLDLPAWESLNKKMLAEGKFALKIPGCRGKNGEGIIYVKMGNMVSSQHENFVESCVQWTVWNGMHGGLYDSMDYFRNGIMMVADLENMGWDNVDMSVQQRIGSALLDNFPMRTCKILIINPPWILNAFLGGMSLFIKKKVMERIYVLESKDDLLTHIEKEYLLKEYGGDVDYDVTDWFRFLEQEDSKGGVDAISDVKKESSSSSSV